MKRKRGHKKGNKSKKSKSVPEQGSTEKAENQTSEQSSDAPAECEDTEHQSKMEVDSTATANSPVATVDPAPSADNNITAKSVARVKVKLKTSKAPEPDVSPRTDINKSSTHEEPVVAAEQKEEPVPRMLEKKQPFMNVYRKTKGIKIKSSKPLDGSTSVADAVKAQDPILLEDNAKPSNENSQVSKQESNSQAKKQEPDIAPIPVQKEQKKSDQISRYNKRELEDSLTVIKKIMKMDAADPFNAPVNPEALGIPDYFDIIKTPMDFGTICNNFDKGNIYMNSEDVYKDVQYIWNNCSKYNKKGDYIVDLMKRVKKNFMKYWTGVGLYTEQSAENSQLEDGGKASNKGGQSKQKTHKRHGRHHKSDCMCAICVLKRRKRERQRGSDGNSGAQEESSPVGSPSVGNSSINMGEEQDMDVDVVNKTGQGKSEIVELDSPVAKRQRVSENKQEVEEEEGKGEEEEENLEVESEDITEANVEDKTQSIDRLTEETGGEPVTNAAEKLVDLASLEGPKPVQNDEVKEKQLRKQKELERKEWRAKMNTKFEVGNPHLLSLCETLFPNSDNHSSVWNGPHSLYKRTGVANSSSSLCKAVDALMK